MHESNSLDVYTAKHARSSRKVQDDTVTLCGVRGLLAMLRKKRPKEATFAANAGASQRTENLLGRSRVLEQSEIDSKPCANFVLWISFTLFTHTRTTLKLLKSWTNSSTVSRTSPDTTALKRNRYQWGTWTSNMVLHSFPRSLRHFPG